MILGNVEKRLTPQYEVYITANKKNENKYTIFSMLRIEHLVI